MLLLTAVKNSAWDCTISANSRPRSSSLNQIGGLIRAKFPVGQLHIQQPVIDVFPLWALMIEEILSFRFLTQDAVLDAKLVILHLDLFDARQA
jgi:hypothetical protein